jgi:prepilin-type N-terminal cleavage/methylation domain-containing protein
MKKTAFTLLELLVTIVLFSLLLATSLYSFRFISINMRNINNSNPEKAINYALLRGAIGSIYAYVQRDNSSFKNDEFYYYFKGESLKCRFITISPLFYSEVAIGELSFIDKKLIYREGKIFDKEVNYKNLDTIPLTQEIIILDNISEMKILYYMNGKEHLNIEKEIPNLIKIKFIHYEKDKEYIFSIKSNNKEQLNMIKSQYKEF